MSHSIDLARIPAPDIVEALDADAIVAALKADILTRAPDLAEVLSLESEPVVKLLEVAAWREIVLRNRINHAARAVMLAQATGADLDNLAALMGVTRLVLDPGDATAVPPVAASYEADDDLRRRVQLAPEGATAAGTAGSYLFYALAADPQVADAAVLAPVPGSGRVEITILARDGDGRPADDLLTRVAAAIEPHRVLTDRLSLHRPTIRSWRLEAVLTLFPGPDADVVQGAARSALDAYLQASRRLGYDITISGLHHALHQPGVQRVALISPAADIVCAPTEAAHCTAIAISGGARDV